MKKVKTTILLVTGCQGRGSQGHSHSGCHLSMQTMMAHSLVNGLLPKKTKNLWKQVNKPKQLKYVLATASTC